MQQPIDRPIVFGHFEIKPTRDVKVGELVHDWYPTEPEARVSLEALDAGTLKPSIEPALDQDVGEDADAYPFAIVVVEVTPP